MIEFALEVPFVKEEMGPNYHLVEYVCFYNESSEEMIDMLLQEVTMALELEDYWEEEIITTFIVVHQWLSQRYLQLVATGQKHEDFNYIVDLTEEEANEIFEIEEETGEISPFVEDIMDYYSYNMSYHSTTYEVYDQIFNGKKTESIENALVEAVTRLRIKRGDFVKFDRGVCVNTPVKSIW